MELARARAGRSPEARRRAAGLLRGAGFGIAYGAFLEPSWLQATLHHVALPGWPAELDGYRIAHLSDIHHNAVQSAGFLARAVALASSMDPDAVALTGDFITRDPARMEPCLAALARVRAHDGVFCVRGNHDAPVPLERTRALMERLGMRLLENESVRIEPARRAFGAAPARLRLAGVGDLWTARCSPGEALAGAPPEEPAILLSHHPGAVRLVPDGRRLDLVLAGHTHGGQVRPFHRELPLLSGGETRHQTGLSRHGATAVFVSRGVGSSQLHFRWNCRPEVALLVLHRAS
ncbi:MAG: metallophosphoesterase [Candidatus Sumerlaeia bacterium]|nr:metallophosphoesterase [Candidatus Sumerlaeia bacterium]